MSPKAEYLIDLIFKKLKNYKAKEIFLEKENFKEFISSLLKESWNKKRKIVNCYSYINFQG